MDPFISLPVELSSSILSEWLPFVCVSHLDSAYCNGNRGEILALFCSIVFSVRGVNRWFPAGMVQWLLTRQMRVDRFLCCAKSGDCSVVLNLIGRYITEFCYTSYETTPAYLPVGSLCPNIVTLHGYWRMLGEVSRLKYLQELKLRWDYSWDTLFRPETYKPFSKLQRMSLSYVVLIVAPVASQIILAAANTLHTLSLCTSETNVITEAVTHCRQLRSLKLEVVITDDILTTIALSCPHICNLDLSENGNITDAGMLHMARSLSELRTLALCNCSGITNIGLCRLQAYHANTLKVLHVECSGLTGITVSAVYAMFPKLHTYRWKSTHELNAEHGAVNVLTVWYDFYSACSRAVYTPGLEILVVHSHATCSGASEEVFARLVKLCPLLHTIAVSNKQHYECLSEIVKDIPQLRVTMEDQHIDYELFGMPI